MKGPFSALIVSLAVLACALVGYAALRTRVADQSVAVVEIEHQIEVRTAAAEHLTFVRETLATLADEEAAVAAYFVASESVVPFIEELQSRGKALGAVVEITSVAATPPSAKGRPKLLIALSIGGPFDAVMRTLGSIEYAPYDLTVTNLVLTQGGDKGWSASVNLAVGSVTTGSMPRPSPSVPLPTTPVSATSSPPASSTPLH